MNARSLFSLGLMAAALGCGAPEAGGSSELVGRWAGHTIVDDLAFAPGRGVRLDEVFELREDGTMRGDFAGMDEVTRCVVTYRMTGRFELVGDALDAEWSSIRVRVAGCADPALDAVDAEVVETEGDLWDDELEGQWTVDGSRLTIQASGGAITYSRVESPLVARWVGTSSVSDFTFAEGRDVRLDETFWMNVDGSLGGYFVGTDAVSGCTADYRMRGRWREVGERELDVEWTSISLEVHGCQDPALEREPTEVVAEEGDVWDDELDGTWTVEGTTLRIVNDQGLSLEYARAL